MLVAIATSRSLRRAFTLGVVAGAVYFTGTLYWITRVMAVYGGLQWWVAVLVNAALIAYLALFPGLFALVVRRLLAVYGRAALAAAPVVWTATELGRAYLFTGFPWVLLGYSQATVLPIAQLASVVGVFGVSALVAGVGAALAMVTLAGQGGREGKGEQRRWRSVAPLAAAAIVVLAVAVWGSLRVQRGVLTRDGEPVRVGLVQGNVSESEREDPLRKTAILQSYLNMTRQVIGEGAQMVLWPESSAPFYFEEDPLGAGQVRALARQTRVPILVGSDQIDWGAKDGRRVPLKYYNSAFLIRADGTTAGFYRKMHLVPFGEYVPLKQVFFFAAPLVEAVSDFSPGESPTLLEVRLPATPAGQKPDAGDAAGARSGARTAAAVAQTTSTHFISVAICYEVVYPDLVRRFVAGGSELLTTITNDAWFGRTSAPFQHFEQASMRAIEDGRYLVRAANTGVSGIVDPYGRILLETEIYQSAAVVGEARFLRAQTIYARIGDAFAYASAALTLALLAMPRRRVQ